MESWKEKRETGFSLKWWVESNTGEKVEVEMEPRYLLENRVFRNWINLFYQLVIERNIDENRLMEAVKKTKFDYLATNEFYFFPETSELMSVIENIGIAFNLNITEKANVSDTKLTIFS